MGVVFLVHFTLQAVVFKMFLHLTLQTVFAVHLTNCFAFRRNSHVFNIEDDVDTGPPDKSA